VTESQRFVLRSFLEEEGMEEVEAVASNASSLGNLKQAMKEQQKTTTNDGKQLHTCRSQWIDYLTRRMSR